MAEGGEGKKTIKGSRGRRVEREEKIAKKMRRGDGRE